MGTQARLASKRNLFVNSNRLPQTVAPVPGQAPLICLLCGATLDEQPIIISPDRQLGTPGNFAVHVCRSCGAGSTTPQVDDSELAAYYPMQYGPYVQPQGAIALLARVYYRWRDSRVLQRRPYRELNAIRCGSLLDVGCGRGDLGAVLRTHGWEVTGIEPSPEACEVVRARKMTALNGVLATIALPERAFDVATFQHVLEHTPDPVNDLRRVYGALKDGGHVLISVPNFGYWQRKLFGGYWYHLDLPRHRFHYTEQSLRLLLSRAGFETLEMSTGNDFVGLPASVQYALFKRCLFPSGTLRGLGYILCAALYPVTWLLGRLLGSGDFLHVVAQKKS